MSGNAPKRSACAAHNRWVNILLQTLFRTFVLPVTVQMQASIFFACLISGRVQPVERAEQVAAVRHGHMKIDHGGCDACMSHEFFYGHYVNTKLQQVRGITVAKRVKGDVFLKFTLLFCLPQSPIHARYA